uniref:Uncharacterized protein n=1 Tax=Arundo donax TaxID=35708 RepID=A0A0A9HWX2_ARUDO
MLNHFFILISFKNISGRQRIHVDEVKQCLKNRRLHIFNSYDPYFILVTHGSIELCLEGRRPHCKHNTMGAENLTFNLESHIEPILPLQQFSKIIKEV